MRKLDQEDLKSLSEREKKVLGRMLGVPKGQLEGADISEITMEISLERIQEMEARMIRKIQDQLK